MLLFMLDGYVSMTIFTLVMLLFVERINVQQVRAGLLLIRSQPRCC